MNDFKEQFKQLLNNYIDDQPLETIEDLSMLLVEVIGWEGDAIGNSKQQDFSKVLLELIQRSIDEEK